MMLKRQKNIKECSILKLPGSGTKYLILLSMSQPSYSTTLLPGHPTPATLALLFCDLTKAVPISEPLPHFCL